MVTEASSIAENLSLVKEKITSAADGRKGVELVCVSKTHPAERIAEAIAASQKIFGENRVQESEAKWPDLKAAHPGIRLHLIGSLQTNKVKNAIALFDVIETVDRPKLARALARERDAGHPCPDLYIQVNTGEEEQKAGIVPLDADDFIVLVRDELGLPVKGLMCIPPVDEEAALHFGLLKQIAERNGLEGLSMGMSADYETAIRFGATLVRVGSAICGARSL